MSKKTITITLPFTEGPALFSDGWCSVSALGVETVKGRTARLIAAADIGAAVRASWEEPASDYARRLAKTEERHVAMSSHPYDKGSASHADRGWLLAQHRAASGALVALGIPDDGRPPAERIATLGAEVKRLRAIVGKIPRA